jgi:general secretion pathway protein I
MAAFVIASLASLVLYQAGFNGTSAALAAAHTQEAVVRAQSRLAAIGPLTALQPGAFSGDDGGGFRWRLSIAPAQSSGTLTLYDVQVTESAGGRSVTLTTQRLGPAP